MESTKKSILFAIDALYGGGAEKVLLFNLEHLDRTKFSIDLFLSTRAGIYLDKIPPDVRVFSLFEPPETAANCIVRLFRRVRRSALIRILSIFPSLLRFFIRLPQKYDIGVSFCEGFNLLLFTGAAHYFSRRISWLHSDVEKHPLVFRRRQFEETLKNFDSVVFVSRMARDAFGRAFPLFSPEKLRVIYNPVDVATIQKMGSEEFHSFDDVPQDTLKIISVGRFMRVKRFDRLVAAAKRLLDEGWKIKVFIVGDGWEREALIRAIAECGVGEHVRLVSFQKNPYAWLRNADVFVSCSDSEAAPLVIGEAMLLGASIVATRTAGATEFLENGKYGILVDFSADALHDGLLTMLNQPELRENYRQQLCKAREGGCLPFPSDTHEIANFFLAQTQELSH